MIDLRLFKLRAHGEREDFLRNYCQESGPTAVRSSLNHLKTGYFTYGLHRHIGHNPSSLPRRLLPPSRQGRILLRGRLLPLPAGERAAMLFFLRAFSELPRQNRRVPAVLGTLIGDSALWRRNRV